MFCSDGNRGAILDLESVGADEAIIFCPANSMARRRSASKASLAAYSTRSCRMALYSCYILGEDGHIKAREIMDCGNDDQALGMARRFLSMHPPIPAVEIWLEERFIKQLAQAALD